MAEPPEQICSIEMVPDRRPLQIVLGCQLATASGNINLISISIRLEIHFSVWVHEIVSLTSHEEYFAKLYLTINRFTILMRTNDEERITLSVFLSEQGKKS